MGTIFELNRRTKFNRESAKEILPLVYKITSEIDTEFQSLMNQISHARQLSEDQKVTELESQLQQVIHRWESKIHKLGLEPKGVWLVDFDTGDGFFCWKYPEIDIKFWHGYKDGYSGRKPIEEKEAQSLQPLPPEL